MEKANIIKAWKDPEYRASLTQEELESLPEHPAGVLDSEDMKKIKGGTGPLTKIRAYTLAHGCGWWPSVSGESNGGTSCNPFGSIW